MPSTVREFVDQGYALHRAGELEAAERLYNQALALEPRNADALHYMGILLRQSGRAEAGLALLRQSVLLAPDEASFHYNLANALDEERMFAEAAAAHRRALEIKPNYPAALMNLALVLQAMGQYEESLAILQKLVEMVPNSAVARQNLARLYDTLGLRMHAFMEFAEAVNVKRCVDTLSSLANLLRRSGDLAQALKVAAEAVELDANDPQGWIELGQTHAANQCNEQAGEAYRRVLALDAGNAEAAFFLAALEGRTPETAPRGFLAQHYDDYANQFESHLEKELQYRAPEKLLAALKRVRDGDAAMDIFDAGCGTGLAGAMFKPLAKTLIGADLSREMIRHAANRKIYDKLIVGDLVEELRAAPAAYDLILAADVFIHLGELREAFTAAAIALRSGGLLLFSVEAHAGPDYALLPTRRFAHSADYIRQLAADAGFTEKSLTPETLRLEKGQPVSSYVVVLKKS